MLVIQGWKAGADRVATQKGKNSKEQKPRPWVVTTLDALCLSGSALSPTSTWQSKGVKNGTKGLASPFIYLPDQQDSEGQANGLLILWASHDQHKARWKKTKPWVALRRAVGCSLWLIMGWGWVKGAGGGRAELGLKSVQNPDSMWLPSHEGVSFNLV